MSQENPYEKLTFDTKPFDQAIEKIRASYDSAIADAGTAAGMAAGATGRDAGRVVADVAARTYSQRDAAVGDVESRKASAIATFNAEKQAKMAEFEAAKPGVLDWLGVGANIAMGGVGLALTAAQKAPKLVGMLGGANNVVNSTVSALNTGVNTKAIDNLVSKIEPIKIDTPKQIVSELKLKTPKLNELTWSESGSQLKAALRPLRFNTPLFGLGY